MKIFYWSKWKQQEPSCSESKCRPWMKDNLDEEIHLLKMEQHNVAGHLCESAYYKPALSKQCIFSQGGRVNSVYAVPTAGHQAMRIVECCKETSLRHERKIQKLRSTTKTAKRIKENHPSKNLM